MAYRAPLQPAARRGKTRHVRDRSDRTAAKAPPSRSRGHTDDSPKALTVSIETVYIAMKKTITRRRVLPPREGNREATYRLLRRRERPKSIMRDFISPLRVVPLGRSPNEFAYHRLGIPRGPGSGVQHHCTPTSKVHSRNGPCCGHRQPQSSQLGKVPAAKRRSEQHAWPRVWAEYETHTGAQ